MQKSFPGWQPFNSECRSTDILPPADELRVQGLTFSKNRLLGACRTVLVCTATLIFFFLGYSFALAPILAILPIIILTMTGMLRTTGGCVSTTTSSLAAVTLSIIAQNIILPMSVGEPWLGVSLALLALFWAVIIFSWIDPTKKNIATPRLFGILILTTSYSIKTTAEIYTIEAGYAPIWLLAAGWGCLVNVLSFPLCLQLIREYSIFLYNCGVLLDAVALPLRAHLNCEPIPHFSNPQPQFQLSILREIQDKHLNSISTLLREAPMEGAIDSEVSKIGPKLFTKIVAVWDALNSIAAFAQRGIAYTLNHEEWRLLAPKADRYSETVRNYITKINQMILSLFCGTLTDINVNAELEAVQLAHDDLFHCYTQQIKRGDAHISVNTPHISSNIDHVIFQMMLLKTTLDSLEQEVRLAAKKHSAKGWLWLIGYYVKSVPLPLLLTILNGIFLIRCLWDVVKSPFDKCFGKKNAKVQPTPAVTATAASILSVPEQPQTSVPIDNTADVQHQLEEDRKEIVQNGTDPADISEVKEVREADLALANPDDLRVSNASIMTIVEEQWEELAKPRLKPVNHEMSNTKVLPTLVDLRASMLLPPIRETCYEEDENSANSSSKPAPRLAQNASDSISKQNMRSTEDIKASTPLSKSVMLSKVSRSSLTHESPGITPATSKKHLAQSRESLKNPTGSQESLKQPSDSKGTIEFSKEDAGLRKSGSKGPVGVFQEDTAKSSSQGSKNTLQRTGSIQGNHVIIEINPKDVTLVDLTREEDHKAAAAIDSKPVVPSPSDPTHPHHHHHAYQYQQQFEQWMQASLLMTEPPAVTWSDYVTKGNWKLPLRIIIATIPIAFLSIAFVLYWTPDIQTPWAITSCLMVMSPTLGSTFRRFSHRALGTLVGALLGQIVVILCVSISPYICWGPLIIIVFVTTYYNYSKGSKYSYVFAVTLLTFSMVLLGPYPYNGDVSWKTAAYRMLFVLVGAIWGSLMSFVFPEYAFDRFAQVTCASVQAAKRASGMIHDSILKAVHPDYPQLTTIAFDMMNLEYAISMLRFDAAAENFFQPTRKDAVRYWRYKVKDLCVATRMQIYSSSVGFGSTVSLVAPELIADADLVMKDLAQIVDYIYKSFKLHPPGIPMTTEKVRADFMQLEACCQPLKSRLSPISCLQLSSHLVSLRLYAIVLNDIAQATYHYLRPKKQTGSMNVDWIPITE